MKLPNKKFLELLLNVENHQRQNFKIKKREIHKRKN